MRGPQCLGWCGRAGCPTRGGDAGPVPVVAGAAAVAATAVVGGAGECSVNAVGVGRWRQGHGPAEAGLGWRGGHSGFQGQQGNRVTAAAWPRRQRGWV